jgi:hypothetical protein
MRRPPRSPARARPRPGARALRRLAACVLLFSAGPWSARAEAGSLATYRFDPGASILDVRVVDMDGDGRRDVVLLLKDPSSGVNSVLIARTPADPARKTFFPEGAVTRIPLAGALETCGALSVGRFGPKGVGRLRFLGPTGVLQLDDRGTPEPEGAAAAIGPTLFARGLGQDLIFWDGVADLDGDGLDELWVPLAEGDGPIHLAAGIPAQSRTLAITANNLGASTDVLLLSRHAYVPNLFPADMDGDGVSELVALRGEDLVGWSLSVAHSGAAPQAPSFRLHLPFLEPDPERAADAMHVPRIQLQDVDQDGTADLLVTLLAGQQSNLDSLRTILFHYPGPIRDPKTGALGAPSARLDTKSSVLHPLFVDVDRDGALEYVGDTMHGSQTELFARMLGKEPKITWFGFRFDRATKTFASAPCFSVERPYASSETLSNHFGRSAWFGGDFDGDGHGDLLDLGNLQSVEILRGRPDPKGELVHYEAGLLGPIPVQEGLRADARLSDLDGDGRTDAVLWSGEALYLIVPKGAR